MGSTVIVAREEEYQAVDVFPFFSLFMQIRLLPNIVVNLTFGSCKESCWKYLLLYLSNWKLTCKKYVEIYRNFEYFNRSMEHSTMVPYGWRPRVKVAKPQEFLELEHDNELSTAVMKERL